jgi:hypothetical protein
MLGITIGDDSYEPQENSSSNTASDKQVKMITDLLIGDADRKKRMLEYYKVDRIEELNIKQASDAITSLMPKKK